LFVLASCSKHENIDLKDDLVNSDNIKNFTNQEVQPPQFDGHSRLIFKNMSSFNKCYEEICSKPVDDVVLFPQEFKSLRMATIEKSEASLRTSNDEEGEYSEEYELDEDWPDDTDSLIWDPYTASLISEKREIIIDGFVFRYTEYGVFMYTPGDEDEMETFQNNLDQPRWNVILNSISCDTETIEVAPSIFFMTGNFCDTDNQPEFNASNARTSNIQGRGCNRTTNIRNPACQGTNTNVFGVNRTCTYSSGLAARRRMKGRVWSQNYLTHAVSGANTRYQRSSLGMWFARNTDEVSVYIEGEIEVKFPDGSKHIFRIDDQSSIPNYRVRSNNNKAEVIFNWSTAIFGTYCNPVTLQCSKFKIKGAKGDKIKWINACHYVRAGTREAELHIVF
jgi:hypothetical protein